MAKKFLIVDKNPRVLGVASAYMRKYSGTEVAIAENPSVVLELYEKLRPDIVALGVSADGIVLAARMRQYQPRPYIILTDNVDAPREVWEEVADAFYHTQTSMNNLLGLVKDVAMRDV